MAVACHENASDQRNSGGSMVNRYWTSSLVICPFVDFALACLVLGMATLFLVSRMTHLCNSLVSCWSGTSENNRHERDDQQQQQQQQQDRQVAHYNEPQDTERSCLACDRSGRLNGICISCVMRVLGPAAQQTSGLFLQEIASSGDGNLVSSSGDALRRHVELLVDKLQLKITSGPEAAAASSASSSCGCLRRGEDGTGDFVGECYRTQRTCRCRSTPDEQPTMDCEPTTCQSANFSSDRRPANAETHLEGESSKTEREVMERLYDELEQERNASAVAANESMAMITRLQEEKARLLMEARQYQRIVEEKVFHDHRAITVLKEMLLKREVEKTVLEEEIEIYRRSSRAGGGEEDRDRDGERRKTSSEETSAAIKAVEEQRLSVLERVKQLEQQLQLLNENENQPRYKNKPLV